MTILLKRSSDGKSWIASSAGKSAIGSSQQQARAALERQIKRTQNSDGGVARSNMILAQNKETLKQW